LGKISSHDIFRAMRKAAALLALTLLTVFGAESEPISVPFKLNHGRIILTARIGESGPLTFLLDSACTIPTLHPELVDELHLTPSGRVRINGIAGEERSPTYRGVVFDFGAASYSPRRVAAVPSERNEPRRRDGVLDAGFFRRFVVELTPGSGVLRLYAPTNFTYRGDGEVIPFRFKEEIPVVHAAIVLPESDPIDAEFEVDTGCDSGLCLGENFVKRHDLLGKIAGRSSEKFGLGGSVETKSGRVPLFRIGRDEIRNVQTDFFLSGSPVDDPLAGHIGMGVLGKRKVIFDYSRKRLIIEEPEHPK
jgi:hypothetical protein